MYKPGDKITYWSIRRGYPTKKLTGVVTDVYERHVRIKLADQKTKLVKIENVQRSES